MPGKQDGIFYSWDVGPIHFISLSTEVYYYLQYGIKPLVQQYEFLEADLKVRKEISFYFSCVIAPYNFQEANKPENRAKRPWIIAYGHRPMYCSNADKDDCTNYETLIRVGIPVVRW